MFVLPMEKHELELVTSTCTMSCVIYCCMIILVTMLLLVIHTYDMMKVLILGVNNQFLTGKSIGS
jgi:hypothetical protein